MDQIDVSLYSDAITVLAHFIPSEEFFDLIGVCLEPERSDAVKIVAVKTYITIVKEVCPQTSSSFEYLSSTIQAPKTPWRKITFPDHIKIRIARIFRVCLSI